MKNRMWTYERGGKRKWTNKFIWWNLIGCCETQEMFELKDFVKRLSYFYLFIIFKKQFYWLMFQKSKTPNLLVNYNKDLQLEIKKDIV